MRVPAGSEKFDRDQDATRSSSVASQPVALALLLADAQVVGKLTPGVAVTIGPLLGDPVTVGDPKAVAEAQHRTAGRRRPEDHFWVIASVACVGRLPRGLGALPSHRDPLPDLLGIRSRHDAQVSLGPEKGGQERHDCLRPSQAQARVFGQQIGAIANDLPQLGTGRVQVVDLATRAVVTADASDQPQPADRRSWSAAYGSASGVLVAQIPGRTRGQRRGGRRTPARG
jgi:hypothetical protein